MYVDCFYFSQPIYCFLIAVIPPSTDKKFCNDSEDIVYEQEYLDSDEEDIVLDSSELPSVTTKDLFNSQTNIYNAILTPYTNAW